MDDLHLLSPDEVKRYSAIIKNYKPSDDVVSHFESSNFCILAGPTGAGKDTLRTELMKIDSGVFVPVLSTTTRPMRQGEVGGIEYHFRGLEYFDFALDHRSFLQTALLHQQQISGIDYADVLKLDSKQVGVAILAVQTEIELRRLKENTKTIFLIPPDIETLRARIGDERILSLEEIDRRLFAAQAELEIALTENDYYCVVNDDLSRATSLVARYFITGQMDAAEDVKARGAIEDIFNRLRD